MVLKLEKKLLLLWQQASFYEILTNEKDSQLACLFPSNRMESQSL